MSCNTALTDEINFAQHAHPGPYGPMNLLLMSNVVYRVHEGGSTMREGAILHL